MTLPNIDPGENRTPSLLNVVRRTIAQSLKSLYTMMPGRVESFDPETQKAAIQPLFRFPIPGSALDPNAEADEDFLEDLPILPEVPVVFPRSKGATIYFPLYPGTMVMLVFSMFSLERFLLNTWESGTVDPKDTRRHSFSDAVAIPGLYPFADPIPDLDDDDLRFILESQHGHRVEVYLGGDTGDFVVVPDGKVQLGEADMTTAKGVARLSDATLSDATTDTTFWTWLSGLINIIIATWVPVPTDGGLALQTAMVAYITANPVPAQLIGKIDTASETVLAKD